MDAYGNIHFLGDGEVGIDRRVAGRDALILPVRFRPSL
jgi:hypothetical protein